MQDSASFSQGIVRHTPERMSLLLKISYPLQIHDKYSQSLDTFSLRRDLAYPSCEDGRLR